MEKAHPALHPKSGMPDFGAKYVEFGNSRIRLDGEGEERCDGPLQVERTSQEDVFMLTPELELDLRASIRTIPDYPSPGIMFRDITTLSIL